ncbi:hypothetical protein IJ096_03320 [Candidatus Saccharibacteria bacterium]|nr:hypothetical protein [Candidatus Saccharibacteria bacterium]
MHNLFAYLKTINKAWLITWAIIYASFLILDIIWQGSIPVTVIKYTGIVLCLVYAFKKWPKDYLLQIALLFTLLADTILVFDHTSTIGVFVFCIAQFFHLARLSQFHFSPRAFTVYIIIILLVVAFGITQHLQIMYPLAGVYLITLIFNVISAHAWYASAHTVPSLCAICGFILFFCCDFNVGISYFSAVGALPIVLFAPANYLAWFFYYPSQVLISNSSKENHPSINSHLPPKTSTSKKVQRNTNFSKKVCYNK